jgi:hypothetical protein
MSIRRDASPRDRGDRPEVDGPCNRDEPAQADGEGDVECAADVREARERRQRSRGMQRKGQGEPDSDGNFGGSGGDAEKHGTGSEPAQSSE